MPETAIRDQAKIQQRVERLVKRIAKEFGMVGAGSPRLTIFFETTVSSESVVCQTSCDWEYLQASLTWNLPALTAMCDADLELVVIHELVHVLLAPLWGSIPEKMHDKLTKLNELATENVTRVIAQLRG